jgi:UDP-N-acetylmuramyl pentapeptide phosphotransferase/UDP-N-acetylglucosamine-1-phosphate transferase
MQLCLLLANSFGLTLVLTPVVRSVLAHLKITDEPDGFRHLHRRPIPRAGGIAIVLSLVLAFGIFFLLPFGGKIVSDPGCR